MDPSAQGRVLVIDDDQAFRFALRKALKRQHFDVDEAASGEEALPLLRGASAPEVALLDLRMRGMDGLEVLRRRGTSATRIIVLTGHGSVQAAVEAMKLGAYSFLEKPIDAELLAPLIRQALADRNRPDESQDDSAPRLVGESEALNKVRELIALVGPTDETVTVFGETGTGKDVVAHQLHGASPRREGPFIAMNAACVPRELFESELFGHRRGAFTGATSDRAGLFREANGGTLFIDELAELPIEEQAKLLRALETRKIRPVGGTREYEVDVRIVCATNRDLWQEVQAGRFREDLYFRLQVFPIVLAPLRERPADILPIAEHLLRRLGSGGTTLSDDAKAVLENHGWPGNVRELLNVLRRASLFATSGQIDGPLAQRMVAASIFGHAGKTSEREPGPFVAQSLASVERAHIERVLQNFDGNVTRAATALGIDRRTLQRKMKAYGMERG